MHLPGRKECGGIWSCVDFYSGVVNLAIILKHVNNSLLFNEADRDTVDCYPVALKSDPEM